MTINSDPEHPTVTAVILAGGRGSRMGGQDKGLIIWQHQPLYLHVLQRLRLQVNTVWVNANRNFATYQKSGIPIIADTIADFPGPLAGMLAALQCVETDWVVFSPCDTPRLPENLLTHLWRNKGDARAVWACSEERDHPAMALLHRSLANELQLYLNQGERRLLVFLQRVGGHSVLFSNAGSAFNNFNSPTDLENKTEFTP